MRAHSELKDINKVKCRIGTSLTPLINYKFYLDIAKDHTCREIESKIKELGGSIEFFLTKDVTHFVTDKIDDTDDLTNIKLPKSFQTSQLGFTNKNTIVSKCLGNERKTKLKIKSRADAMLHRARLGLVHSFDKEIYMQKNLKETAKSGGKSIWHTTYALEFFQKIDAISNHRYSNSAPSKRKLKIGSIKVLKNNYIKLESFHKGYRPYYNILKGNWPKIRIDSINGFEIFDYAITVINDSLKKKNDIKITKSRQKVKTTMTRKNRTKHIRDKQITNISTEKECGFCEICRVEYDVLKIHLKTSEHLNFVKNDTNFIALDSLIRSSTNIDNFLSINNQNLFANNTCELFTKRESKRSTITKMKSEKVLKSTPSVLSTVAASETDIFFPRTRQSMIKQSVNVQNKSRNEGNRISRARRESAKKINYDETKEDDENSHDETDSDRQKRRKKERPLLYKVVERNDESDGTNERKEPLSEKNIETAIIVKFRKVRQSEVSLLSGEAENFMFPKKYSSELLTDMDRQTSETYNILGDTIIGDKLPTKRKCSNTHFDHEDNYKKNKSSQLSFQNVNGNFSNASSIILSPTISTSQSGKSLNKKRLNNNACIDKVLNENKMRTHNLIYILSKKISQYKFAFERVPKSELWYEVFHRQDESREKMFEYYGSTEYRKLPYEMGPIPPLSKKLCQICSPNYWKDRLQNCDKPNKIVDEQSNNEICIKDDLIRNKLHMCPNGGGEKTNKPATFLTLEMPRKSPREHASTLAILSCLIQQKDEKLSTQIQGKIERSETASEKNKSAFTSNCDISLQISENVKRYRRGKAFTENCLLKQEKARVTAVRNFESKMKKTKEPLEFNTTSNTASQIDKNRINVNALNKDIDKYLSQTFNNSVDMEIIPDNSKDAENIFVNNIELDDIFFDSSDKFMIKNRLRLYKHFPPSKKRKNNKTGWPKKKRLLTRQQNTKEIDTEFSSSYHIHFRQVNTFGSNETESDGKSILYKERIKNCTDFTSENGENSDVFTVSSDSLDTVLDVGSQIKSEDQKHIIAKGKCKEINISTNNDVKKDILKIIKSKNNEKNCQELEEEGKISINSELNIAKFCTSEPSISFPATSDVPNCNSLVSLKHKSANLMTEKRLQPLSPRRLRKPRGRWYRER